MLCLGLLLLAVFCAGVLHNAQVPEMIRARRLRDDLIPIQELPELIPSARKGKKISMATVHRWIRSGRLWSHKIGGARYVRVEALAEFVLSTNDVLTAEHGSEATISREVQTEKSAAVSAGLSRGGAVNCSPSNAA